MSDDFLVPEEDTGDFLPKAEELESISQLVTTQLNLEGVVDELETRLKQAKTALRIVQEDKLPNAILNAGMEEFTMADGLKVSVVKDMSVSLPKKNITYITNWLRGRGYADIIKASFEIDLNDVPEDKRIRAKKGLEGLGIICEERENVNTASVKALLKRCVSDGEDVDLKTFGAHMWRKAVIKQ